MRHIRLNRWVPAVVLVLFLVLATPLFAAGIEQEPEGKRITTPAIPNPLPGPAPDPIPRPVPPLEPSVQRPPLKPEQQAELEKLYNQLLDTKKRIVEKSVQFGQISSETGAAILERLESRRQHIVEWIEKGGGPGFGMGMRFRKRLEGGGENQKGCGPGTARSNCRLNQQTP